jgi:hypothetical protein
MFASFAERAGQEVRGFRDLRRPEEWLALQAERGPAAAR